MSREQDYLDFDAIDPKDSRVSIADWNSRSAEDQLLYVRNLELRGVELDLLLTLIPACPIHGHGCIPHAEDWIRQQRERESE